MSRRLSTPRIWLAGAMACAFQVLLLMAWAPKVGGPLATYLELNNWDSRHYVDIAEHGYHLPERVGTDVMQVRSADIHEGNANVVFFPGYPMAARLLSRASGIPVSVTLLWVSHLCCWLFWVYFLALLRATGASPRRSAAAALAILIHPASFFLVTGYTESLFLASMLGYLFWSDRWAESRRVGWHWVLAALHGLAMSFTRIVSYAAAPYPLLRERRRPWLACLLGGSAILGSLLFFAYCQHRFGRWDVYFRLEEIGWGNEKKWWAIIDPLSYLPRFFFEDTIDSFNRLSVPFTALLFCWLWRLESKRSKAEMNAGRLGLYFVAFFLFFIPLTGKANAKMDSMVRYTLPVYVLQVLCLAQFKSPFSARSKKRLWIGALFALAMQAWFCYRFVHGRWVA